MNQIPFKTEKGNYLCIEVPGHAKDFSIAHYNIPLMNCSTLVWHGEMSEHEIPIPNAAWSIVGAVKDITDEDLLLMFDGPDMLYPASMQAMDKIIENKKEQFNSLLKANGIYQDKHYLILKQG